MPACSIIIPVYNQWELSRACLRSISATTRGANVEIILVDNASTDVTPKAAPFLGKQLFGPSFTYIRNKVNRNFAGASNQGARMAKGEYLVFLNNDTVVLPGWLEGLFSDFSAFPNLAATGPLLLYPEKPLVGHTVQHLGVTVSPFHHISHLYEGIPASSPLARRRRFFQIITAAAMMMPRQVFFNASGFDEEYKNGLEDVDLCARLSSTGLRLTVNPSATVIHYQGQSVGRSAHELENSKRMRQRVLHLLRPDKSALLAADDLELGLNAWLIQVPLLNPQLERDLNAQAPAISRARLLELLSANPYWSAGWLRLLKEIPLQDQEALGADAYRMAPEPALPLALARAALAKDDRQRANYWFFTASVFCRPEHFYAESAASQERLALSLGERTFAEKFSNWQKTAPAFFQAKLQPFIAEFAQLARELRIPEEQAREWKFALKNGT